jgi:hypothetical protein
MRQLLEKQRNWLDGTHLHTLPIPYPLTLRLAQLGGFFGTAPIDAQTVSMLQRGNTADVAPLQQACGFTPMSMDEVLRETPATDADRWHARLFFLAPLLRISLALLWIFTGLVSAFFYPAEQSYALLQQAGISNSLAPLFLYSAATLDLLLGLALLLRYRIATVALLQGAVILGYTLIISVALPEFWLHPYGPVSKNLPLLVATLVMLQLERE